MSPDTLNEDEGRGENTKSWHGSLRLGAASVPLGVACVALTWPPRLPRARADWALIVGNHAAEVQAWGIRAGLGVVFSCFVWGFVARDRYRSCAPLLLLVGLVACALTVMP